MLLSIILCFVVAGEFIYFNKKIKKLCEIKREESLPPVEPPIVQPPVVVQNPPHLLLPARDMFSVLYGAK